MLWVCRIMQECAGVRREEQIIFLSSSLFGLRLLSSPSRKHLFYWRSLHYDNLKPTLQEDYIYVSYKRKKTRPINNNGVNLSVTVQSIKSILIIRITQMKWRGRYDKTWLQPTYNLQPWGIILRNIINLSRGFLILQIHFKAQQS